MEIFTKIAFSVFESKVDYHTECVFMGSCFSENIGGWLKEMKFDVQSNICGITYNPVSIARHISRSLEGELISESELLKSRETYVHPDFHSFFKNVDAKIAAKQINNAIQGLGIALRASSFLFLTFGTSIAFENKSNGQIVNNCHHLPSFDFLKRMLKEDDMLNALDEAFEKLLSINPDLKIILTVSPIRHLRHGATDNNRSKARLIRLCEMLENKYPNTKYLPIFEFVMDELRDYRFYRQDDFIHLNELGIHLIREKFSEALISQNAFPLMARIKKWKAMADHKIENAGSEESKAFLKKLEREKNELAKLLPGRF
ncbi:GSCFA domain-containing protein [Cryomorpha ignava]|uniref:GSCFA domain-containing protein n=1 Tax=Cryomorpha ignava TaxID=101383 RepID=A0A7K3WQK3_9FLAO|nr:GSCFA domain-containing protein [Cryomorpha ignava]NEN23768.1 GSCFA domain-containing protein [Cryomorpha ignava]